MRCAIYARVSTEFDSQKTSIDNQLSLYTDYANSKGWDIVKIFTDKKSGTKSNRPGLKKLIEDAENNVFDVIITKELSRLARNGSLSHKIRDLCFTNNIHIICLDNSINTLEDNAANFGLFAWLYEMESMNSSRRNKQAKSAKARRGKFIGSNAPYGYSSDNGVLMIREDDTPEVVKRIFSMYVEGIGMDTIAKKLTVEKIPTPSQVINKSNASPLWHQTTIKNILSNRHYCGDLVQNNTETVHVTSNKRRIREDNVVVEDTHDAIIDKTLFESVQSLMLSRTRAATAPQKHLYTNTLYCEECNKGLWYKANQKGYRCGGNLRHGDGFCVNKNAIREKDLSDVILQDLRKIFSYLNTE
ncbi:MAG: site-specific recombinase [Bacillales bacterium]|jgi:DNA invertase Pin-like site-specific DNA recombinase|nr:site-specific recombinase [Bacillales bacterium]